MARSKSKGNGTRRSEETLSPSTTSRRADGNGFLYAVIAALVAALVGVGILAIQAHSRAESLQERMRGTGGTTDSAVSSSAHGTEELRRFKQFDNRVGNAPWTKTLLAKEEAFKASVELDQNGPVDVLVSQLDPLSWPSFLDDSGMSAGWRAHLDATTPVAFQNGSTAARDPTSPDYIDCRNAAEVTIAEDVLANRDALFGDPQHLSKAMRALRECGYVVLENLFPRGELQQYLQEYKDFIKTAEAEDFKYPCQGKGRMEYMMPFRSPFNDTLYSDDRLQEIIFNWLRGKFKLELITVINSLAGSGNQRWHQGWQYLFHPEERTPPYAIVVGTPLVDVTPEMGPTEFCPRAKMRFYQGWRCKDEPFSVPSSLGSVIIFDYKTLHRGPENQTPFARPMISMVFSKMFFVNTEAMMNRGISLLQTLHQRMYWEQFKLHPDSNKYFQV